VGEIGVPSTKVIEHDNMLTRKSLEKVFHVEQPSYHLLCKRTVSCTTTSLKHKKLSTLLEKILRECEDVFPKEGPKGLPNFRGIEHQIELVPMASLLNRPAYTTNPQ